MGEAGVFGLLPLILVPTNDFDLNARFSRQRARFRSRKSMVSGASQRDGAMIWPFFISSERCRPTEFDSAESARALSFAKAVAHELPPPKFGLQVLKPSYVGWTGIAHWEGAFLRVTGRQTSSSVG